jgi:acetyltransferase-like isoleucine patch superfamily enzyme
VRLGRGVYVNVASGGRLIIGEGTWIGSHAHLTADGGTISIGADSFLGDGTIIVATHRIEIGRDALIAAYVAIRDQDHGFDRPDLPYRAQPLKTGPVKIGSNVWLGTHTSVLKGVSIGDGAIVGANAVVTADLPAHSICVGAPARVLRGVHDGEGKRGASG